LSPNFILGYTDTETVKLDFDDVTFKTVLYWARRAMSWFSLGGFLILKSSDRCYHVVFNHEVDWTHNMKIVAWVALLSKNEGLRRYLLMQCIKESSTLRLSPKGEKPFPRIVYHEGEEDDQIMAFLRFQRQIKNIVRKLDHMDATSILSVYLERSST